MKIAIIGAGILGLSNAYCAAKQGMDVSIFEKQDLPPKNASAIAGGMLAPFSEIEALPMKFVQAGLKGIDFWKKSLPDTMSNALKTNGSLFISHLEDKHMLERFATHLPNISDDWEWVDNARLSKLEPAITNKFERGLYIPQEASLHPVLAIEAMIDAIKGLGGRIVQQEANPIKLADKYDWVIDCRGYAPDIDSDLRGIKGEIILLENKEFKLSRPVRLMHPRYPLYIIPRPNNIFAVGASVIENATIDDGSVLLRSAMELMSAAYSLNPNFGNAKIIDMSSAIRPAYMDNLPRIKIDGDAKYIRCNGLFRHGYLLSPIMGKSVANYIKTGEEDENFSLFSGRFNIAI